MTTPYAIKSAFQAERLLYAELAKDRETRSDLRELAVAAEEAAIAERGRVDTWEVVSATVDAGTQIAKAASELAAPQDLSKAENEILARTGNNLGQELTAQPTAANAKQSGALQDAAESLNRAIETAREHSQNLVSV